MSRTTITPTAHYFVEPARNFSKSATTTEYVIYKASDVVTTSTGECGVTLSEQVAHKAQTLTSSSTGGKDSLQAAAAAGLQELRIATEADHEFVIQGKVDDRILRILNQVEGLYEFDLALLSEWFTKASRIIPGRSVQRNESFRAVG